MPVPFATYKASDARVKLPKRPKYSEDLDLVLAGDLWKDGEFWLGELPANADVLKAMARGIVGENVSLEILTRYVAAVLGSEPRWKVVLRGRSSAAAAEQGQAQAPERTPVAQPLARADGTLRGRAVPTQARADDPLQIEADLTAWWDERKILKTLQKALAYKAAEGRGPLYAFVPPGLLDAKGTIPTPRTLEEALRYIYVDARPPSEVGIYTDSWTRMDMGVVLGKDASGNATTEVTYLNERRETVLHTLTKNGKPSVYNLNGRLFVHDSDMPPILIEKNQISINIPSVKAAAEHRHATDSSVWPILALGSGMQPFPVYRTRAILSLRLMARRSGAALFIPYAPRASDNCSINHAIIVSSNQQVSAARSQVWQTQQSVFL